jgi:hypothetical protein
MRRPAPFATPPAIVVVDESLGDDAASAAAQRLDSGHGLEIVPAWQARPPRRLRPLSAAVPLIAVAVAAARWIAGSDNAPALRERPAAAAASETARGQALVVSAAPTRHIDSGSTGR